MLLYLVLTDPRTNLRSDTLTLPWRSKPFDGRYIAGADPGGGRTRRAPPLKLEKIWFFGVKSWFFTRNTPKIFAPPSVRRNFFKCAPPNLKSWIRPCIDVWNKYWKWYFLEEFDDTKMTTRFQTNNDVSLKKYRNGFYFNTIRIVILEAAFRFICCE